MSSSTTLRVGIDGFNLSLSRGTGVASYARTLSFALRDLGYEIDVLYGMNIHHHTPSDLREVIFADELGEEKAPRLPKLLRPRWFKATKRHFLGHEVVDVPISGRVNLRDFAGRMPAYDRIQNVPALFRAAAGFFRTTGRFLTVTSPNPPDIMHWTYPLPIRMAGSKNIYTVHDLVPLTMPHTTLDNKNYHYRLIRSIVENSDGICTVSEFARSEILSFFPAAASKIVNTYQSFTPDQTAFERPHAQSLEEISSLFGLEGESYYLFFGSLEPKKNIGRIISAFLSTHSQKKLVLVGAMAWKSENELRFLQKGLDSGRIVQLQYLPLKALQALIRHAFAVLFPSLTEGFGLPVLEALSFGTPVITSREASLPEVGGEACLYVDAYDTDDIARGIVELENNPEHVRMLRSRGEAQARKFDMATYEARLSEMYRAVLDTPPRRG